MKSNEKILSDLSGKANSIMRNSLNFCSPLYKEKSNIPYNVQFTFIQLFSSCYLSSESALILIANYRLWDTEIIYRSILEGTIKLFYLSYGSSEEIVNKSDEYWVKIPEYKRILRHYKATNLLEKINDKSLKYEPIRELLLSDEELNSLTERYPRKYRKELEKKWSFGEMVQELSNSKIEGFDTLIAAYYGYSLSSHLIHQDGDGIGLIWDRNNRDTARRTSLELAHGARLISDVLSLNMLRTRLYFQFYGIGTVSMQELSNTYEAIQKEIGEYYNKWLEIEFESISK